MAALTHTLPSVSALLRLDHGPDVVVGADRRCLPDLSPCGLRRLVGGVAGPDLSWLSSVVAVELGGPDVTRVVEDVVCVGGRDEPVAAFVTLLDPLTTRAVLRDVGHDARDGGAVDPELLRMLERSLVEPMPLALHYLYVRQWSRLYGMVTLEAFGHLRWALADSRALFEAGQRYF